MVVTRKGQTNLELLKSKVKDYFKLLGRDDITLLHFSSPVLDSMGRETTKTSSSSTITGDLQWDTVLMKPYIELGLAEQGNGLFYCESSVSVSAHDKIVVDGVYWELTVQVEGEKVSDDAGSCESVYQGWVAVRKPDV